MDAVEKDDLDCDAGRHLDDGLVLFCAFDEVFADRVGGFARALAEAACENVGRRERVAPAVAADRLLSFGPVPRPACTQCSRWLLSGPER